MLTGKTALVTGAGRGIGREIALTLAREGADVAINYNGSADAAKEVAAKIEALGRKAVLIQCNVADFQAAEEMIKKAAEELGRLDILVNNAGITKDNLLLRMSEAEYDAVLDINLKGCFNTIRHAAKLMIKQRSGRIINLSSVSGVMGNAGQANYCASKAGIIGLTKSAARELASRNVTVNAIAPGFIETEMTAVLSDSVKENILAQIPMHRLGNTKDIAEAAAFLASDRAGYITGQVIQVNGGMAM
ncbi:MAG: 3-oxoacyl-[acyl-carrier-protein] reductase [Lachnospiraceae bacterium]|nr:3-oxoacyl-[acyl-carrier-protein] reductase [Lachnospiraceae bacterium]